MTSSREVQGCSTFGGRIGVSRTAQELAQYVQHQHGGNSGRWQTRMHTHMLLT